MSDAPEHITVTEDGLQLPVTEVLAGRGFITGKSGSGKSNTASVVAEELLDANFPILIIDTDGEYYGLKEHYEMLQVGADEDCDVQVRPGHAKKLAELALEENVPIIVDVSGYVDEEEMAELVRNVVEALFVTEKKLKKPFLLLVEEAHEFIPESGGMDELGRTLIKVAKRGRKRGLGICAMSQRPAAVSKDYITQCDWLVWHRLTWDNDTRIVGQIMGSSAAETVQELDDGEALMMTDWDDKIQQVQFRRKKTFDAGATPGLGNFERPELKSVGEDLVSDLQEMTELQSYDQIDGDYDGTLRKELDEKQRRIDELEAKVQELRNRATEAGTGDDPREASGGSAASETCAASADDAPDDDASTDESTGAGTGDATAGETGADDATADALAAFGGAAGGGDDGEDGDGGDGGDASTGSDATDEAARSGATNDTASSADGAGATATPDGGDAVVGRAWNSTPRWLRPATAVEDPDEYDPLWEFGLAVYHFIAFIARSCLFYVHATRRAFAAAVGSLETASGPGSTAFGAGSGTPVDRRTALLLVLVGLSLVVLAIVKPF